MLRRKKSKARYGDVCVENRYTHEQTFSRGRGSPSSVIIGVATATGLTGRPLLSSGLGAKVDVKHVP